MQRISTCAYGCCLTIDIFNIHTQICIEIFIFAGGTQYVAYILFLSHFLHLRHGFRFISAVLFLTTDACLWRCTRLTGTLVPSKIAFTHILLNLAIPAWAIESSFKGLTQYLHFTIEFLTYHEPHQPIILENLILMNVLSLLFELKKNLLNFT